MLIIGYSLEKYNFQLMTKLMNIFPSNTETDSGHGGKIWEWFDEPIRESDKELINALLKANSAKMKFIGRQYYDIKL